MSHYICQKRTFSAVTLYEMELIVAFTGHHDGGNKARKSRATADIKPNPTLFWRITFFYYIDYLRTVTHMSVPNLI